MRVLLTALGLGAADDEPALRFAFDIHASRTVIDMLEVVARHENSHVRHVETRAGKRVGEEVLHLRSEVGLEEKGRLSQKPLEPQRHRQVDPGFDEVVR